MTLEQLERRVVDLEREVAQIRSAVLPLRPYRSIQETFGMFADDPDFDEIVKLGRDYRNQVNAEDRQ
jgi:hypothetical protein